MSIKVMLVRVGSDGMSSSWHGNFERILRSASIQKQSLHIAVDDAESADVILFVDPVSRTQADVRRHPLAKNFPRKVMVYSTRDRDVPMIPGIYTSVEAGWYRPTLTRAGFYTKVVDHDWIVPSPVDAGCRYLYSFCGSFDTHPMRRRLAAIDGGHGLIRDTSRSTGRLGGQLPDVYRDWSRAYFLSLVEAKFVLCPRGAAPSSFRIFEAMKAGRVPVIISDAWVEPDGPDWGAFSLRIPERRILDLPEILIDQSSRAAVMGAAARAAWDHWFAADRLFGSVASWCAQIQAGRSHVGMVERMIGLAQLFRPFNVRHVVGPAIKSQLQKSRRS